MPEPGQNRGKSERSSYSFRVGKLYVTIWPRSFPWLVQYGRRTWWLFDRGQNLG